MPNLSLIGDGWVCTGALKFPLLVRFRVFQCFTTSEPAKRAAKIDAKIAIVMKFGTFLGWGL